MFRRDHGLVCPCPSCDSGSIAAMAGRDCPSGYWAITFKAPLCEHCKDDRRAYRTVSFGSVGSYKIVTLKLTDEEFVGIDSPYRRALASKSKEGIIHGNLEAAAQRVCSKIKDKNAPQLRQVLNAYAPFAIAARHQDHSVSVPYAKVLAVTGACAVGIFAFLGYRKGHSPFKETIANTLDKGLTTAMLLTGCAVDPSVTKKSDLARDVLPLSLLTLGGALSLSRFLRKDHRVKLEWCPPHNDATPSKDVTEALTECGSRGWTNYLHTTRQNAPEDPVDTKVPVVDPTPGDPINGTLPDGTQVQQQQGTMISASTSDRLLHADTAGNVKRAKHERMDSVKRPVTFTKEDKQAIGFHVAKLIHHVFNRKAVENALSECGILEVMKSPKWTEQRLENAVTNANIMVTEKFPISVSIKNEGMKPSKAPRMIIADGDVGQVCALALTTIFEYILFHRFKAQSIKHASKQEAMDRVLKELASFGTKPHSYVENDGSAWDTTCSHKILTMIERPIFKCVWEHMLALGWPDSITEDIHSKVNYSESFRALKKAKHGGESFMFVFDCMQRSGRRPTSSSNFLINLVMDWAAYNPSGVGTLHSKGGKTFTDRWGHKGRKLVLAKEGDDTADCICPPLTEDEAADVRDFWIRGGFNMKMFIRSKVLEFAGWKVPIIDGVLQPDMAVPDFLRNIEAAAITTSSEAKQDYERVAASKFMSYSLALYKLPTVSQMFRRWADDLKPNVEMMEEDVRRLGVKEIAEQPQECPDFEREETILRSLGILDKMSYKDFCLELESQQRDGTNEWFHRLAYSE